MKQYIKKKNDAKTIEARRRAGEEIRRIRVFQKGKVDYKELIDYGRKYILGDILRLN